MATALISAPTQAEVRHVRRTVVGNAPTTIGIGARWNKACESIGVPDIVIDTAPADGFVCIRRGRVIPRHVVFGGARHCLGSAMNGVDIVYQSRPGFTGRDRLAYTLKYPRGDRMLAVDIRVKPSPGRSADGNALAFERQTSGPAPECAALTS